MHKQTLTVHCATTICFDWLISFSSQHKAEFAHRVVLFLSLRPVSCVWWSPSHIALCFNFCFYLFVLFLVYGGVHHILLCVLSFVSLRPVSCVWWSPSHIALCFIFCFSYVLFLVYGGVHHILICVLSFVSLTSCFLCI
jgi:hypothetical protein